MNTCVSIPIPTEKFLELVNFLQSNGDSRDPVEIVEDSIQYWLDNASWKPELLKKTIPNTRGYQWKDLFLVHGTEIRMQYKGTYFYAKVEYDKIIYEGEPISPGRLSNTIAGTSRNAWNDLWIKRPKDKVWKLADELRKFDERVEKTIQEIDAEYGKPSTQLQQP